MVLDPTGKGLSPVRLPPAPYQFRGWSHVQIVTRAGDQLVRGSREALFYFSLLEQLKELRGRFYLLDHWFIIKQYNSGRAIWKRCRGQVMMKGSAELPCSL